jgi:hypothetical protein
VGRAGCVGIAARIDTDDGADFTEWLEVVGVEHAADLAQQGRNHRAEEARPRSPPPRQRGKRTAVSQAVAGNAVIIGPVKNRPPQSLRSRRPAMDERRTERYRDQRDLRRGISMG